MHGLQDFAEKVVIFLHWSRDGRRLWNRLDGESFKVDDSRAHDNHMTNSRVEDYCSKKLQPMQLLEFDFIGLDRLLPRSVE